MGLWYVRWPNGEPRNKCCQCCRTKSWCAPRASGGQPVHKFFEPLMAAVESINDPGRDGIQDDALLSGFITGILQAEFQFLQPVPHAGEIGLDIRHEHFEFG